jgi:hypothetical protein
MVNKRVGCGVGMGVFVACANGVVVLVEGFSCEGITAGFNPPRLHAVNPSSRAAMTRFLKCMLNEARLDTKLGGILIDPGK